MDALQLIESCYADVADDECWGTGLATVFSAMLGDWTDGVTCITYRVDDSRGLQPLTVTGDNRYAKLLARIPRGASEMQPRTPLAFIAEMNRSPHRDQLLRATYGATSPAVGALSQMPQQQQGPLRRHLPWSQGDAMALFCSLDGVHGVQLGTASPSSQVPSARRHAALVRLSEHLAVGYWLRRLRASLLPSAEPVAVYAPDGRRLDRTPPTLADTLEARLANAVRQMDQAHCRRRKHAADEATALWQALVAGRYALVESFERGGRRVVLAVSCRSPRPALTRRELMVAQAAARGLSNKLIGAALGIRASTVGVHLAVALRKLGCSNRRLLNVWLSPMAAPRNQHE